MGNIWVNKAMEVICDYCGKIFLRSSRRYNEAIKNKWRQFCSLPCQSKSRDKRILFTCHYNKCQKSFLRLLSDTKSSKHLFCSKPCSAKYYGLITKSDHAHLCEFPGCKNTVTSNYPGKKYCSPECLSKYQKLSSYTVASVIAIICNFYNQNGRIPLKYELGTIYSPARQLFGTWNKAIIAAGYDPNPVRFAHQCIAKD
jgi:hypothetical protein